MAEAKISTPEVNFLAQDDLEGKSGGRFLRWALSWGKKIIIITELVVISAFLSRFYFDTQVANLADQISRDKAIVLASAGFEKQFRSVATRIDEAKTIEQQVSPVTVYDAAQKTIPSSVSVAQISTTATSVSFAGQGSEPAISQLVTAFKQSPNFTAISVERIAKNDINPAINFSLTATFVETH